MPNSFLTVEAAHSECRRLLLVIGEQRRKQNRWFGAEGMCAIEPDENSAFFGGMTALFRYARGEAVPAPIVQDFLDDLLELMFCGLATNTMALPPFRRMEDRPWAVAWRLSELRLALEGCIELDVPQLAHLLGIRTLELEQRIRSAGFEPSAGIPDAFLDELYQAIKNEAENSVVSPLHDA